MGSSVDKPEFWRRRLQEAHASGRGLHTAVFDADPATWNAIQCDTRGLIRRYVKEGEFVLDAGCGYGAMYDLVVPYAKYHGVDVSPELVEIAYLRHPLGTFELGDMRDLGYPDHTFDWAVCRSIKDMTVRELGHEAWFSMEAELRRVAKKLLLIEYDGGPFRWEVV